MYTLCWDKRAIEFLSSLEIRLKERIWNKIQKCKENPLHYAERLEASEYYKLRIGDYRAILYINHEAEIIQIVRIGHRKNVYR